MLQTAAVQIARGVVGEGERATPVLCEAGEKNYRHLRHPELSGGE
jgi:hypothetical protein